MNLREALIVQNPSLELQRAAQAEIARLDGELALATARHYKAQAQLARILELVQRAQEMYNALVDSDETANCFDHADVMEIIDLIGVTATEP